MPDTSNSAGSQSPDKSLPDLDQLTSWIFQALPYVKPQYQNDHSYRGHVVAALQLIETARDEGARWLDKMRKPDQQKRAEHQWSLDLEHSSYKTLIDPKDPKDQMFAAILTRPRYHDHNGQRPLLLECCIPTLFRDDLNRFLPGYERQITAASNYLVDLLRPLMQETFSLKNRYEECFDRFEYLTALVYADLRQKSPRPATVDFWGPVGRFTWRNRWSAEDILKVVTDEISKFGENWALLKVGLFDGSLTRLNEVKAGFDKVVNQPLLSSKRIVSRSAWASCFSFVFSRWEDKHQTPTV